MCLNYQTNKVNLARSKGENAALRAFMIEQGLDPDTALKAQPPPSNRSARKVRMRDEQSASAADGTGNKGGDGDEMYEEG